MKYSETDGSITIRQYSRKDIGALYDAVRESVEDLSPWLPWCSPAYQKVESTNFIARSRKYWSDHRQFNFGIFDAKSGELLGGVGLNQIHPGNRSANLGYWIRSSARGRGIGAQAVKLAAKFAFEELKLLRSEIVIGVGNAPSQRVAEKAGAMREGVLRNRLVIHDTVMDAVVYSIVPGTLPS